MDGKRHRMGDSHEKKYAWGSLLCCIVMYSGNAKEIVFQDS
jgi:hypothetical protein